MWDYAGTKTSEEADVAPRPSRSQHFLLLVQFQVTGEQEESVPAVMGTGGEAHTWTDRQSVAGLQRFISEQISNVITAMTDFH